MILAIQWDLQTHKCPMINAHFQAQGTPGHPLELRYIPSQCGIVAMVELTVGYVSGIIAAGIFVGE